MKPLFAAFALALLTACGGALDECAESAAVIVTADGTPVRTPDPCSLGKTTR